MDEVILVLVRKKKIQIFQIHIVVHEQSHERIQQVQHQHQHEVIRHGHIKKHEHYEHVNGDVRVQIMKETEQL